MAASRPGGVQRASDLAVICPLADPGDQAAYERCRLALFHDSLLHRSLNTILL